MTTTHQLGHSVSLSKRLRHLLRVTISDAGQAGVTLSVADDILRESSNEQLNERLKIFDEYEPLLTAANGLTPDRRELNRQFFDLRDEWGENYYIRFLLDADEQGLRTHSLVGDVKIGQGFEIEGPAGDGNYDVLKQWQRVAIGGDALINGKVAARVIYGVVNDDDVELYNPDTEVRPHFMSRTASAGSIFPTPTEQAAHKREWDESKNASAKIENRVVGALGGPEKPKHVIYSAYESDANDVPIDNLDDIAIAGRAILLAEHDDFWGGDESESYKSPVVENPTWLDLCVLANAMIESTGDYHHVFLEGVNLDNDAPKERSDDVKIYRFSMGS